MKEDGGKSLLSIAFAVGSKREDATTDGTYLSTRIGKSNLLLIDYFFKHYSYFLYHHYLVN
jgi:hypothetical protein